MNKLIIASDQETLNFARDNYPENYTTRKTYFFPFKSFLFRKRGLPCFLSNDTAQHHRDLENIKIVQKKNKIERKDLSIVIFDAHTDMYYYDDPEIVELQGSINMTNWVLNLLEIGYDDLSIVGVSDFTKGCPEKEGYEYWKFNDKINFFLGKDFNKEHDFKENTFYKTRLMDLEDFMDKKLRKYTFISLDSDVSEDFAGHPMSQYTGYKGKTKIHEIVNINNYIKNNSQIIGFSLYGMYNMGFFSTFPKKKEVVKEVLDNL